MTGFVRIGPKANSLLLLPAVSCCHTRKSIAWVLLADLGDWFGEMTNSNGTWGSVFGILKRLGRQTVTCRRLFIGDDYFWPNAPQEFSRIRNSFPVIAVFRRHALRMNRANFLEQLACVEIGSVLFLERLFLTDLFKEKRQLIRWRYLDFHVVSQRVPFKLNSAL